MELLSIASLPMPRLGKGPQVWNTQFFTEFVPWVGQTPIRKSLGEHEPMLAEGSDSVASIHRAKASLAGFQSVPSRLEGAPQ